MQRIVKWIAVSQHYVNLNGLMSDALHYNSYAKLDNLLDEYSWEVVSVQLSFLNR